MASAGVLLFLLGNFQAVSQRIPQIEKLISTQGVLSLIVTVAIIKVLHELGHAMACRRFGAECLEIGVMFLAFIPTLYCNVSDAWSIGERWKRMVVSFAGMYVEICLAAIAAVAWFMTPPGLLNALLFNVVILCSINTILVNGNPLLRYDGYYLLSDWLEKPNLGEAAAGELNRVSAWMFRQPFDRRGFDFWLLAYAILSFVYRWLVVGVILCAIVAFASIWQARTIGVVVASLFLVAMSAGRFKSAVGRNNARQKFGAVSWIRSSVSLIVLLCLLGFVLFVPLPRSVYCGFEVQPQNGVPVYSPADGRLVSLAHPYTIVDKGDPVARLENRQLEQNAALKKLELARAKNELKLLEGRINESPLIASRIEVARENVSAVQASCSIFDKELSRLDVVAPQRGVLLPAPIREKNDRAVVAIEPGSLAEPKNDFAFVKSSELLVTVADPRKRRVVLFVEENDMDFVEVGQSVRLMFDRVIGEKFDGSVKEVFADELESNFDPDDIEADSQHFFRVVVKLSDEELPDQVVAGAVGQARIVVPSESLGQRLMRVLTRAMNTRL